MGYYEYDTGYYEPSEADVFFDEMKEKFREYLNDDVKAELVSYEKHNKDLQERLDKATQELQQLKLEKNKAAWSRETIRREVVDEFYNTAIDALFQSRIENIDVWFADNVPHEQPKCEYCNDERVRVYTFPDGFEMRQRCSCEHFIYSYEPKLATRQTLQYRVKPSKYNSERKYYMADWKAYDPNNRYTDYGYSDFKILHIVNVFDENTIELRDTLSYGEKIGFKTKEECQKYCDWLNTKRSKEE